MFERVVSKPLWSHNDYPENYRICASFYQANIYLFKHLPVQSINRNNKSGVKYVES